jgi:GDP-mannose 6-dehydrogenase
MKISIFGLGYVGCISLGCLAKNGHTIIGVDVSPIKVEQINNGLATIIEKDIDGIIAEQYALGRISATVDYDTAIKSTEMSLVTVGTPGTDKGHLNLEHIFNVASNIGETLKNKNDFHIIAIRSTILPGTTSKFAEIIEKISGKKRNIDFAVVNNPEFLREGCAVQDYYHPSITLIGSDNNNAAGKVAELYSDLPGEIIITDLEITEIMKYINNAFHALKISFSNEIGNICSEMGIDSHKVMEILCKDKQLNISSYYLLPGFAYGGSCLPKDLKALQTIAHDLYVHIPLIESINVANEIQIQRAIKIIYKYWNKKLGFLGLSFKAGTDDLRNSPAVSVIESLLGKGCHIKIYDKNVNLATLTGANKEFIEARIPHLRKLMIDDPEKLIAESEVIIINTKDQDFEYLVKDITDKIIIDFVRIDESMLSKSNYIGGNW